jgi:hypothetical protein
MEAFTGTRVEIHDEWAGSDEELELTLTVWGRRADGTWLARKDARCPFSEEDVEFYIENDGTVAGVDEDPIVARMEEAFPGADVWFCYDGIDSELGEAAGKQGAAPVFEMEIDLSRS